MGSRTVPQWDRTHQAILDVVEFIAARLDLLTSSSACRSRQVAAGYLARCRRLLLAMDLLRLNGFIDGVGLALRPFFEAWLYGMWALLGDPSVIDKLVSGYKDQIEKMNRLAGLELKDIEGWEKEPEGPAVEYIAREVDRLLSEAGDSGADTVFWSYQMVYRNESQESIHGGLGSVLGHLRQGSGDWLGVREIRGDVGDATGDLLWAAVLLVIFARRIFQRFGIATAPLDAAAAPLEDAVAPRQWSTAADPSAPPRL